MNFYFAVAKTLDRLDSKQGSVKNVLGELSGKDRRRTSALIIETLKHKAIIQEVISCAGLMNEEGKKLKSLNLALILVHDLLFSGGIQAGDGPIKQAILRHKTRLHAELQKIVIRRGVCSRKSLIEDPGTRMFVPRYVRVNILKCTTEQAITAMLSRGFTQGNPFHSVTNFAHDEHVPDLLLFSPKASIVEDPLYLSGQFILQDKASCFPAVILSPPPLGDCHVIDATAAPGNKTSHLSAIMKNKGKIFAFERDKKRYKTLLSMLTKAGCKNVEPFNVDFLTLDPSDAQYQSVTHILLDPSCSGSGIVNRLDHLLDIDEDNSKVGDDRLQRLASFQVTMVKHAMKFPNVEKIVYSTCSIYPIENEHVVRESLISLEAQIGKFRLADPSQVLPTWSRRGLKEEMIDQPGQERSLIRCLSKEDATNGFFVACFIREQQSTKSSQKGEVLNNTSLPKKKRRKI